MEYSGEIDPWPLTFQNPTLQLTFDFRFDRGWRSEYWIYWSVTPLQYNVVASWRAGYCIFGEQRQNMMVRFKQK